MKCGIPDSVQGSRLLTDAYIHWVLRGYSRAWLAETRVKNVIGLGDQCAAARTQLNDMIASAEIGDTRQRVQCTERLIGALMFGDSDLGRHRFAGDPAGIDVRAHDTPK